MSKVMVLDPEVIYVAVISSHMLYFPPAAVVKGFQLVGSGEGFSHSFVRRVFAHANVGFSYYGGA